MAITFENAQLYFASANHIKSSIWATFNEDTRKAAIAQARRLFSRELNRAIVDPATDYVEGDRVRWDYAIYEQAVYMLEHGQIADASGNDPVPLLTGRVTVGEHAGRATPTFAPEAIKWIGGVDVVLIRS